MSTDSNQKSELGAGDAPGQPAALDENVHHVYSYCTRRPCMDSSCLLPETCGIVKADASATMAENKSRTLSSVLYLNSTKEDGESRDVVYECKVFNITMLSLSLCVLTVTAITCCVSHLNRWRHRRQARKYERAVACDLGEEPVNLQVMQRSQSLRNAPPWFLPPESFGKDDSSIYYICTNPILVGRHDDDVDSSRTHTPLTDPKDDIMLDPPTFYMQL